MNINIQKEYGSRYKVTSNKEFLGYAFQTELGWEISVWLFGEQRNMTFSTYGDMVEWLVWSDY